MVKILREAEKTSVAEVAKKHGVSEQTLYVWRKRFGGMDVAEAKRLKVLRPKTTGSRSCWRSVTSTSKC